jgi:predicted phage tail protein
MRIIRVYGRLAKFLKRRTFRAEVASAAEAVRFLLANFPEVEAHMATQHYRVSIGARALEPEGLHEPAGRAEITIVPVIGGAGAVGRIIAGVALVGLSLVSFGAGAFAGLGAAGAFGSSMVAGIGASLALGGVAQLLTPVPRIAGPGAASAVGAMASANSAKPDSNDPRKSYSFSGIQNTSRQGVPVPVIFGEVIVGSVVISAAIDVDQVAT